MYSKAGNQIAHPIMYGKDHIPIKGYSLLSGAGTTAACPGSVDSPSTMEL